MSYEPLPPKLEQDIRRFAESQHISHDEAIKRLLEKGLRESLSITKQQGKTTPPAVEVALKKVRDVNVERRRELASLAAPIQSATQLIGILQDEPELIDAIRDANRERRHNMYEY